MINVLSQNMQVVADPTSKNGKLYRSTFSAGIPHTVSFSEVEIEVMKWVDEFIHKKSIYVEEISYNRNDMTTVWEFTVVTSQEIMYYDFEGGTV